MSATTAIGLIIIAVLVGVALGKLMASSHRRVWEMERNERHRICRELVEEYKRTISQR